jgi:hypothetical protein
VLSFPLILPLVPSNAAARQRLADEAIGSINLDQNANDAVALRLPYPEILC